MNVTMSLGEDYWRRVLSAVQKHVEIEPASDPRLRLPALRRWIVRVRRRRSRREPR
jgi:hypothetical protein